MRRLIERLCRAPLWWWDADGHVGQRRLSAAELMLVVHHEREGRAMKNATIYPTMNEALVSVFRAQPGLRFNLGFWRWPDLCQSVGLEGAIAELAEHPSAGPDDAGRISHLTWARIRDTPLPWPRHAPHGRRLDQMLAEAAVSSPTLDLEAVLRALLDAGDVRATLRRQIAALQGELAKLEKLQPAAKGAAA